MPLLGLTMMLISSCGTATSNCRPVIDSAPVSHLMYPSGTNATYVSIEGTYGGFNSGPPGSTLSYNLPGSGPILMNQVEDWYRSWLQGNGWTYDTTLMDWKKDPGQQVFNFYDDATSNAAVDQINTEYQILQPQALDGCG